MEGYGDGLVLDAGLVASAQAVEQYERARYHTLNARAVQLGPNDAAKLLDATLAEEMKTDKALTRLGDRAGLPAVLERVAALAGCREDSPEERELTRLQYKFALWETKRWRHACAAL